MNHHDHINPPPDGIFSGPARRWGAGVRPPPPLPAIFQTTGPILDPKTAFDSSGLKLSEYVAEFYLNVTDDATG